MHHNNLHKSGYYPCSEPSGGWDRFFSIPTLGASRSQSSFEESQLQQLDLISQECSELRVKSFKDASLLATGKPAQGLSLLPDKSKCLISVLDVPKTHSKTKIDISLVRGTRSNLCQGSLVVPVVLSREGSCQRLTKEKQSIKRCNGTRESSGFMEAES